MVDAGAQRHLVRLLTKARGGPFWGSWVQWSVETYAEFLAALDAFLATEAISWAEAKDFQNRMLVILGRDPIPVDPNANGLPYVWVGAPSPWVESEQTSLSKVVDNVAAEALTPWGGRYRVHQIEFYDDRTVVHWDLDRWEDIESRIARAREENALDARGCLIRFVVNCYSRSSPTLADHETTFASSMTSARRIWRKVGTSATGGASLRTCLAPRTQRHVYGSSGTAGRWRSGEASVSPIRRYGSGLSHRPC